MRFARKTNLLQNVCNEGAIRILAFIHQVYGHEEFWIHDIVNYKDGYNGSKAIHFAAASGKREVIGMLIYQYGANIYELTEGH